MSLQSQFIWLILPLLFVPSILARPPAIFVPIIYPDIEMKISHYGTNHVGDVSGLIEALEGLMTTQLLHHWPGRDGMDRYSRDYREGPDTFDIRPDYRVLHTGTQPTPYEIQRYSAYWGILQWLRQWRNVGWVPQATFTVRWVDRSLPGGEDISHGSIGSQLLDMNRTVAIEDFNSTTSNRRVPAASGRRQKRHHKLSRDVHIPESEYLDKRSAEEAMDFTSKNLTTTTESNATRLGEIPPDPWEITKVHPNAWELRLKISGMGDAQVLVDDMIDLRFDCLMHYVFELDYNDHSEDDWAPIKVQPMSCAQGPVDSLQIFMNGNIKRGLKYPYVQYQDVRDILEVVYAFYLEYRNAGKRWAPSVRDVYGESWDLSWPEADPPDPPTEYEALKTGWWGKPKNLPAHLQSLSSNATLFKGSMTNRNITDIIEIIA